ncbi:endonuclease/exonuclease/phosphatase family protein [Paenibacillus sp. BC26]|uniref:endonuclease/exonuclease/phosphatase family protein n=1 Tax=Paenibacillus sp. BC26 TaxID=1881032 RepID=UPI0008E066A4|nr:endonuclease/exonuclease/phosphatase family protein [Paenibacillus sp. BC26]SFS73116.1 Exonuclease III [Paenibacillus sp. BC26]
MPLFGTLLQNDKRLRISIMLIAGIAMLLFTQLRAPLVFGSPSSGETANLKIMSYNIWLGGDRITLDKTAQVIQAAGADLIGIQEGGANIPALAQKLGFYYDNGQAILSRYPIIKSGNPDYVYIEVKPGKVVAFSNVHLLAYPYGPYDIRDGISLETVLNNEQNIHMQEMKSRFENLPDLAHHGIAVFLTGDFNVPSHLDWIDATKSSHFGITVNWPVSTNLEKLQFRDSYREIHSNPVTHPAYTWTSEIRYPYPNEVHDRIDFVYAAGPSVTTNSQVVGENGPYSDIVVTPWPSDHRAMLSTFTAQLAPTPEIPVSTTTVATDKADYVQGESIAISYTNAYGPKDWVGIYPTGTEVNPDIPSIQWQYIGDADGGTLTFDSSTLEPGTYDAVLLYNDGYQELKRTTFQVTAP